MDASVQRVLPEPVVAGARGTSRPPERRKREGERESEPHFTLEGQPAEHASPHVEPHTPKAEGLGENLDVIA